MENNTYEALKKLHGSNLLLYIFGISFLLYLLTKSVLFAFLGGISLIGTFLLDIYVGALKEGWKKELIELAKAFVVALALWFGISFLLGTSVPISGVVSCSLLPSYERGDFVIVQGIKVEEINAPTIEITSQEIEIILSNKTLCGSNGPINYICQNRCSRISSATKEIIGYSPECVRSITINSSRSGFTTITENLTNDVIVYASKINEKQTNMDIVHRTFLKLKVDDKYYLLTKGDNNNYMDISYFDIVKEEDVKGKVIFRIPILGYIKLFISGPQYYGEPEGCDTILLH